MGKRATPRAQSAPEEERFFGSLFFRFIFVEGFFAVLFLAVWAQWCLRWLPLFFGRSFSPSSLILSNKCYCIYGYLQVFSCTKYVRSCTTYVRFVQQLTKDDGEIVLILNTWSTFNFGRSLNLVRFFSLLNCTVFIKIVRVYLQKEAQIRNDTVPKQKINKLLHTKKINNQ